MLVWVVDFNLKPIHCMPPMPPITQALILLNVAMFCLDFILGGRLTTGLMLYPFGQGFAPWQLVSYGFLHASFNHLFFNMLGIWMFGAELERLWGPKRYLQLFMASVVTAALMQLVINLLGSPQPTLGASGGLFGLLLAFGMMFPNQIIMLLIPPVALKAKYLVAIYGGLALLLGLTGSAEGIAHFAHLGGMLGAFLMIWYWRNKPRL